MFWNFCRKSDAGFGVHRGEEPREITAARSTKLARAPAESKSASDFCCAYRLSVVGLRNLAPYPADVVRQETFREEP